MYQRVVVAGKELIIVARISSAIGIKGGVKSAPLFFSTEELKGLFLNCNKELYLIKGRDFPKKIRFINISSDHRYVKMELEGVDTKSEADKLSAYMVAVPYEIYLKYINDTKSVFRYIGYMVHDVSIGDVGVIGSVLRQGQILFLVNKENGEELLLPFADGLTRSIDDKKRIITMDLPEGLI